MRGDAHKENVHFLSRKCTINQRTKKRTFLFIKALRWIERLTLFTTIYDFIRTHGKTIRLRAGFVHNKLFLPAVTQIYHY